uniref:Uncharacterized protein n=1 Tax=Rhizophora mucronata TaxID=61149 RepID=A0A2P2NBG9_RHIMU
MRQASNCKSMPITSFCVVLKVLQDK